MDCRSSGSGMVLRETSTGDARESSRHHDVWAYGKWLHFEDLQGPSGSGCCGQPDVPMTRPQSISAGEVVDRRKGTGRLV